MNKNLMILDDFIFNNQSLAPDGDSLSQNADFAFTKAIKANTPNFQFLGVGEKTRELKGNLYPAYMGGLSDLEKLKQKMKKGRPVLLSNADGKKIGKYLILNINEELLNKLPDGSAQKINYSISLRQVD